MKRVALTILGLVATACGIVGVWLPGIPTTIFVLIALWAFSQVSPRLERWFMRIPVLKQAIREAQRFQHEGTVRRSSKLISQGCSWLSFVMLAIFLPYPVVLITVGLLAISCSVFMWWVPTAESVEITKTD